MRNLTSSMRSKFSACHRAFKFCYQELKRPVKTSDALTFGKAFHEFLEAYWTGKEGPEEMPTTGDEFQDMTLLAVTGEAFYNRKVQAEIARIRRSGATWDEAVWTAKMLASTY